MQILESAVEHKVVRWAEERGLLHTKLNLMGNRGWPDRVFWLAAGHPVLIEFKRRGQRSRKLQQAIHMQLQRLGYDVYCVDQAETGINILQDAIQKQPIVGRAIRAAIQQAFFKTVQEHFLHGKGTKNKLVHTDGNIIGGSGKARAVGPKATSHARFKVPVRAGVRRPFC